MSELLLVEDHKETYKTLISYLSKCGHKIYHRDNGKQAYDFIKHRSYKIDLILLDVILPGMNGIELCRLLRESEIQTPILILTTIGDTDHVVKALQIGADDYLVKPFSLSELRARIKAILRRPNYFDTEKISKGEFLVDLDKRIIYFRDQKLELRRKEFDLLSYMIKNNDQTVTRDLIFNNIWGADEHPVPNSIDVHISQLRLKLNDKHHEIIETIHGFGYRLNVLS